MGAVESKSWKGLVKQRELAKDMIHYIARTVYIARTIPIGKQHLQSSRYIGKEAMVTGMDPD